MRGAVACNSGRYGVKEGDRSAYRRRANRREHDLPGCQGRAAGERRHKNRPDQAGPAVKGSHAGRDRDKEWQGVNGQGKQQAEQSAEVEKAEDDAKDEHGGELRTVGCTVAPPPPPWRKAQISGWRGLRKLESDVERLFLMLQILQLEQFVLDEPLSEESTMTAQIDQVVSAKEIAEARRKARALRSRVAHRRSDAKIDVDVGTLRIFLKVVDATSPRDVGTKSKGSEQTSSSDEISPQEAADILRMSRPSVMRLISLGHLHPRKILSRNKLSRAEVVAYQENLSRQQRRALDNLAAMTEEYDF